MLHRKGRLATLGVMALSLSLSLSPATIQVASALEAGYSATAQVGSRVFPLTAGTMIEQGTQVGTACDFPQPVTITWGVPADQGAVAIEVRTEVDDQCNLVAQEVRPMSDPPSRPTTRAAVNHYGYAEHEVQEYVNIPVTEVHVEMKYTRNGGTVCCGNSISTFNYDDGTGWTVTTQALTFNVNGPSSVFVYQRTKFSNPIPPHPSYAISARFTANPGPNNGGTCTVSQGSIPLGWGDICRGGLYY